MSEDSGCRVRDLLPGRIDEMEKTLRQELGKAEAAGGTRLAWSVVGTEATNAIAASLDCDLFDLLARGWCVARELHEYTDPIKHPPDERSVVHLGEHGFTTSVHPVLTCAIGPMSLPPLRLTLALTAQFKAVALAIKAGHIGAVGAGECFVSAQLSYREVNLHPALDSRHVKLPGEYRFRAPGLAIV